MIVYKQDEFYMSKEGFGVTGIGIGAIPKRIRSDFMYRRIFETIETALSNGGIRSEYGFKFQMGRFSGRIPVRFLLET